MSWSGLDNGWFGGLVCLDGLGSNPVFQGACAIMVDDKSTFEVL